jgi:DNA polymerase III delta prime subunit
MSIRQGLRIAFTGAGGTGKTTTAGFVAKELGLPILKSASRSQYEVDDLTETKVQLMDDQKRAELQFKIFDRKIVNDRGFSYVADRTILDHYSYCLAYCSQYMSNNHFLEVEEKVRTLMLSTYSHIFYFPWGYWVAKDDGVRQNSWAWQSQIDTIIVGYLNRWNIPVTVVPQEFGEDHRNEFILNYFVKKEEK